MGRIKNRNVRLGWRDVPSSGRVLGTRIRISCAIGGFLAALLGRFDESLPLSRRELTWIRSAESWESWRDEFFMGQLDKADEADFKKALELSPDIWASHNLLKTDIHHATTASG